MPPTPIVKQPASVAIVLKGYPRLSETFIAQEIHALEQRGLRVNLVSLRHPTDAKRHPINDQIKAPINYLPEYLYQQPLRLWRAFKKVRKLPGYKAARSLFIADLKRDRTSNRIRRFGQALVLAAELDVDCTMIYAHFLHTPASVARYAARINGCRWSCSAHAKDIWTIESWEKREKLADCDWLVTCTAFNQQHLASLAAQPERVELVYHGIDPERFTPPPLREYTRDGRDPLDPVQLLSVGRAVHKKGFDLLLSALATLPSDIHWCFNHVGGGELLESLKNHARSEQLSDRIQWLGAMSQTEVIEQYRQADLFVLPCRVTDNGDRDGLPNVLMEAQTQALACLSTNISGVPELIDADRTGVLVESDDSQALARALLLLITEPDRRKTIGQAGQQRVLSKFTLDRGISQLVARFPVDCFINDND